MIANLYLKTNLVEVGPSRYQLQYKSLIWPMAVYVCQNYIKVSPDVDSTTLRIKMLAGV